MTSHRIDRNSGHRHHCKTTVRSRLRFAPARRILKPNRGQDGGSVFGVLPRFARKHCRDRPNPADPVIFVDNGGQEKRSEFIDADA